MSVDSWDDDIIFGAEVRILIINSYISSKIRLKNWIPGQLFENKQTILNMLSQINRPTRLAKIRNLSETEH